MRRVIEISYLIFRVPFPLDETVMFLCDGII